MAKQKKIEFPVKFQVGDKVRVRRGFMDVDYPDMPMGGWAGTVTDVDGTDTFTVRWSKETMESIHPVFMKRCEIDGLDLEEYVLTGDDIAGYDPEEDADIYEYWKAEDRYWAKF